VPEPTPKTQEVDGDDFVAALAQVAVVLTMTPARVDGVTSKTDAGCAQATDSYRLALRDLPP
jgi:hypothetical protein